MADANSGLVKELTKVMTEISMDIREIKTTLFHFGEKFDGVQREISDIKTETKENALNIDKLKIKLNTIEVQSKETKDDVEILFRKNKERDLKSDADRKWLIGTIITVAGLVIAFISLAVNFF